MCAITESTASLLLQDATRHLRCYWHFNGFVTSDCGAITDFFSPRGTISLTLQCQCRRGENRYGYSLWQRLFRAGSSCA